MIAAKKLAFEKKNLSSEEYHARLLQKINNVIGDKNGVMKPNQLAQSVNNAVGIGSDGSQIFKEPIKYILATRINYQVVDETTILVDLPLIFIDFNWHSVFNSKVSELKDEEIVLPFPDCIFKITYLDKQPVIHARQSSETFKITLDILSDDTELDVAEIKQHILAACLSIELNLVTLPPTAKINLNIKRSLSSKVSPTSYFLLERQLKPNPSLSLLVQILGQNKDSILGEAIGERYVGLRNASSGISLAILLLVSSSKITS